MGWRRFANGGYAVTCRTRRPVRDPQPPRGKTPPAQQDRTQGHAGDDSSSDSDVSIECAVLDAQGVGRVIGVGRSKVYELDARDDRTIMSMPRPIPRTASIRSASKMGR